MAKDKRPHSKTQPKPTKEERHRELLQFERLHWERGAVVAGLDEAGAGPLAGPVTAACVVLDASGADALLGSPVLAEGYVYGEGERALLFKSGLTTPPIYAADRRENHRRPFSSQKETNGSCNCIVASASRTLSTKVSTGVQRVSPTSPR